jgi:hypothetical protein
MAQERRLIITARQVILYLVRPQILGVLVIHSDNCYKMALARFFAAHIVCNVANLLQTSSQSLFHHRLTHGRPRVSRLAASHIKCMGECNANGALCSKLRICDIWSRRHFRTGQTLRFRGIEMTHNIQAEAGRIAPPVSNVRIGPLCSSQCGSQ